ncbi:hypothetical protein GEMRC1_001988 [Eukaryota sp. GEM-RC1]
MCEDHISDNLPYFQFSCVVLINCHFVRFLLQHHFELNCWDPHRSLPSFLEDLHATFAKVGYVSQRFFESTTLAVRFFLQRYTFPVVISDFQLLSTMSSTFQSKVNSIYLIEDRPLTSHALQSYSSIISGLRLDMSSINHFDFLESGSSQLCFSNLKRLDVVLYDSDLFQSLCQSLSVNDTVEDLSVEFEFLTTPIALDLVEVFSVNHTINKVKFSYDPFDDPFIDEAAELLFSAISNNESIHEIDLSNFPIQISNISNSLFISSTLNRLAFPLVRRVEPSVFAALKLNSSIVHLIFNDVYFSSEDFTEVFECNSCLKNLELHNCSCSYSLLFNSLVSNSSLLELTILGNKPVFNDHDVQSLIKMIELNDCLIALTLVGSLFNHNQFELILRSVEGNSTLKSVGLPSLSLNCLSHAGQNCNQIGCHLYISPHTVNIQSGIFIFSPFYCYSVTLEDISSLQSVFKNLILKSSHL